MIMSSAAAGLGVQPRLSLMRVSCSSAAKNAKKSPQPSRRVFRCGDLARDGIPAGTSSTVFVCSRSTRRISSSSHDASSRTAVTARAGASSASSVSFPDDDDDSAQRKKEKSGLVGYPGRGRLSLIFDGYSRMALPTKTEEEAQKRPISDIFWGFIMCFITFAALGAADAYAEITIGRPFIIGSFGTIAVLAFGALDAPVLRRGACLVLRGRRGTGKGRMGEGNHAESVTTAVRSSGLQK